LSVCLEIDLNLLKCDANNAYYLNCLCARGISTGLIKIMILFINTLKAGVQYIRTSISA